MAKENVSWFTLWKKVLDWKPPLREVVRRRRRRTSRTTSRPHPRPQDEPRRRLAQEQGRDHLGGGEPGDTRVITYAQLHREVCQFANVLKDQGVKRGDRVCLYMPMIPELAVAMLAHAEIGAAHSIVFGGFSADALRDRINDAEAKLVVAADGGYRKGAPFALKATVAAVAQTPCVEKVIVVERTRQPVEIVAGRDLWYHELMTEAKTKRAGQARMPRIRSSSSIRAERPASPRASSIRQAATSPTSRRLSRRSSTSRTTTYTAHRRHRMDTTPTSSMALANGATTVMYEGTPTHPGPDRWWDLIEKWGVTIFYTAPTAIRNSSDWATNIRSRTTFLRCDFGQRRRADQSRSVDGYHRVIGNKKCPIVDTWWQTETGGIMISSIPAAVDTKPGSATKPFPGVHADIFDEEGNSQKGEAGDSSS